MANKLKKKKNNPGHFKKGFKPWHAGKKIGGIFGRHNEFQVGHRPHTQHDLGAHRKVRKYLQVKIAETNIESKDWAYVHHLLWEKHHGPVPKGMILVFRDKNENNIVIDNLEIITRAENMRRNSIHRLPKELVKAIMINGKLRRVANGKPARRPQRKHKHDRDPERSSVQPD